MADGTDTKTWRFLMLLVYQPDRETQLRALLEGKNLELVGKAYNGRKFTFATAKHSDITSFTTAEERAVFTVNIHDLIEYALTSKWYQRAVYDRRIGGDGSTYMLLEAGVYKYMFTERNYTTELFVSPNIREVLEAYLVNEVRCVKLEGIDELKALREHLWKNPYE
jgi:hypothetical protein